ncbi:SpoIIE family protein phosphatase [Fluviicola sp.]|uniref:PP2C family protein-serine/threonine phosphatase n=1 Tax=Fluviicola sp. TaxID=1917219 RepID=UPI0026045EB7|nr:SpoIIE family protein phosphatase [Fluviicola sp.]
MINRILNNGISVNNTDSLNRKIRVSNLIALLIAVIMIAYTPMYIYFEQPVGVIINSFFFLSALISFFLIHQKKYIVSFFVLICCSFLYFIITTLVYGTNVNLHFFMLVLCMISVVVFNSQNVIRFFIALSIISFFSLVIWSYFHGPFIQIPKQTKTMETLLGNVNLLLLFLICSLFLLFLKVLMIKSHNRIVEQKNLIEEKNRDLTDSIRYALRIQNAMLPSKSSIEAIFPGHFLFFKPKDIVSGDFYWVFENEDYQFVAVGDCTGHGVPGSMMSVLGINLLIEIVENKRIINPGTILNELRHGILLAFDKDGKSTEYKDGMDIAIVRINRKTKTYCFAAANNALYHLTANDLQERRADKQPVGFSHDLAPFTQHDFTYENGDTLVLFTDGFADQFGGPKNKKFRYKSFQELLMEYRNDRLDKVLDKTFHSWKKDLEQVDDVCILGITL